jgi:hypothetical protein
MSPPHFNLTAPRTAGFTEYEVDWAIADGARVCAGDRVGWLTPGGHCALLPLNAPANGVLSRRTSLLPVAQPGALLGVVGDDVSALRAEERRLLCERRRAVELELRDLEARSAQHGAAATLLAADARRLRAWLAEAEAVLASR